MRTPQTKPSFGRDLVEAMKLVIAHQRGEIELEQVLLKSRVSKAARKPDRERRTPRVK